MPAQSRLRVGAVVTTLVAALTGLGPGIASDAAAGSVALSPCVNPDHGNPIIDAIVLSRSRVDVRRHARVVVISVRAHDTGGPGSASGIASVQVSLLDAPAAQGGAPLEELTARHVGGDLWQARLHLSSWTALPFYAVAAAAVDRVGQSGTSGFPAVVPIPEPTLTVLSLTDHSPPVASQFRLSATHIDTRSSHRDVTVSVSARDPDTGVAVLSVGLNRINAGGSVDATMHRVRGGNRWAGRLSLPSWAQPGRWIPFVSVGNKAGTYRTYVPSRPRGIPRGNARLRLPTVHVAGRLDPGPPRLLGLATSPTTADVRESPVRVVIDVHLRDAVSGVKTADLVLLNAFRAGQSVKLRLAKGTRTDGIWRGQWLATTCHAPAGTWTMLVNATDAIGRFRQFRVSPSAAAVTIQNVDRLRPQAFVQGATSTAVPIVFDEDVVGISATSATIQHLVAVRFGVATPVSGHWECQDAVRAGVDCAAGPVRVATFLPDAPLLRQGFYTVTLNPEHVLDVLDLAGNPAGSTPGFELL